VKIKYEKFERYFEKLLDERTNFDVSIDGKIEKKFRLQHVTQSIDYP
jgi:hypothetical protein